MSLDRYVFGFEKLKLHMMTRWIALFLALTGLLGADTLYMRNGSRVEGSFLGGEKGIVRFLVGGQVSTYYVSDIESIRFSNNPGSATAGGYPPQASGYPPNSGYPSGQNYPPQNYPPQTASNYPPPSNYPPQASNYPPAAAAPPAPPAPPSAPGSGYSDYSASQQPAANSGIQVPAGTQIVVRLIDPVNSEHDNLGQTYRASVDQPVYVNGQTVIPRGADAVATLIDDKQSGKITGRTVLTLDLKTVTVRGQSYDIVTTGVSKASSSRGARSAGVIGGGAALGAIIGAAAGGGRGAAIGAGAGAGAGTVAELATSGQKVKLPAETRLTFTLQNPINF